MRDIKIKYGYSDGINMFEKAFTLDEIEQGLQFDETSDSPLLKNYKIVHKRQYTGLKDKNGVEIYEGDIVNIYMPKVSCPTKESIVRKIVSFEYGSFTLEWIDKNKNGFWATFIRLSIDCSIEVIGNIYENTELLN